MCPSNAAMGRCSEVVSLGDVPATSKFRHVYEEGSHAACPNLTQNANSIIFHPGGFLT